jgi:hypothetical protein
MPWLQKRQILPVNVVESQIGRKRQSESQRIGLDLTGFDLKNKNPEKRVIHETRLR